jgi:hypothetical protein
MKVCTVILTHDTPLYNHFDNIKRKYLDKKKEDYFFVYNGKDTNKENINNRTLNYYSKINHPAGIPDIFLKFIDVIKKGLLDEYDYIIRCNSSTFVNIDTIKEELTTKKDNLYMGVYGQGWNFISGTCIVFSKDVIKKLADNFQIVNYYREDDVVIGDILSILNVPMTYIPQYNFHDSNTIPSINDIENRLSTHTLRIRNDFNRELIDVSIWNMIADLLKLN